MAISITVSVLSIIGFHFYFGNSYSKSTYDTRLTIPMRRSVSIRSSRDFHLFGHQSGFDCGSKFALSCAECLQGNSALIDPTECAGDCTLTDKSSSCVLKTQNPCNLNEYVHQLRSEELDITCDNIAELEIGDITGRGWNRQVFEATWHGKTVAVKEIYFADASDGKNDVLHEAAVLFQLRESENVSKLIGLCKQRMVFEYAPTTLENLVVSNTKAISVKQAFLRGLDAVKGVEQLHSIAGGPIAHNDIHLGQFLVNSMSRVLLSDFDNAKYAGFDTTGKKCLIEDKHGIYKPCSAPEKKMSRNNVNESSDIYEVALVLWALLAGEVPYQHLKELDDYSAVNERILAGERPDLSLISAYPQEMRALIVEAWDGDPKKRPTASELAIRMEDIVEKYVLKRQHDFR